jgi:hypothetical protein
MATVDEIGRRAGEAARSLAAELARTPHTARAAVEVSERSEWSVRRHRTRSVMIAACAAAAVIVASVLTVNSLGSGSQGIEPVAPPDSSAPSSTVGPSTTSTTKTTSEATGTTMSQGETDALALTRPIIGLAECAKPWARPAVSDVVIDNPFAMSSSKPIAFQVIGSRSGSLLEPFAMVLRRFADQRITAAANTGQEVNGLPAQIFSLPVADGYASVDWVLPDGSEGYLRTRTMGRDQLVSIAESLIPRSASADIPGFDLGPATTSELSILDENIGGFATGPAVRSGCNLPSGATLDAFVTQARPLANAWRILERPHNAPVELENLPSNRLLIVSSPQTYNTAQVVADALESVRQATPHEWDQMIYQPRDLELSFLPSDQTLTDALHDSNFANSDAIPGTVELLLRHELGDTDGTLDIRADNFFPYYEWVFTIPTANQQYIARRWSVQYDVNGFGGFKISEAHTGILCSNGTLQPDDAICGP